MDSSGSPSPDHSWLAFSLSNQYYHHHHPSTSPPPTSTQHQPHHHHNQLSFFQQHPHLYFPPPQPVDEGDGASRGNTNQSNHELSFLGVGDGLLQVGVFPTAEAVTVASIGGGGDGGGVYQHQHHHQQQLQVQVQQADEIQADVNNKQLDVVIANQAHTPSSSKKLVEGFGQRTSIYRGVTRHRWTGRYEAHLWDNSCRREGQSRKGRQVYLGGYDKEEKAARAYDLAALKYWGPTTTTNFPISDYEKELEQMNDMSRQEFVASLRRKSSGFSRGASMYRGVTRHHQHGRWQARIGRVAGNKDLYLGTFSTQEEAAEAYDIAAIKFRGLNAVTNFDISRYDVKSIISSNLPVGGMSNKSKSTPLYNENKPQQVIKPELPLIVPNPNHNSFIGPPIKPASTSQSYPWPALGHQAESNVTPIGYAFGYAPQQQPPPNGNDVNNNASQGYNRYYESSNNNNNNNDNNNDNASNNREVGVSGNNSSSTSTSVSNSWIVAPSLHSLQSPKQSVPVLQTPIFGIE